MSAITLKVNSQTHTVDVDPTTPLLYALSDDHFSKGDEYGIESKDDWRY
jgi:aerobic-type carbon monoxide dehydrogenase small subunit (CoxS/CutS family)